MPSRTAPDKENAAWAFRLRSEARFHRKGAEEQRAQREGRIKNSAPSASLSLCGKNRTSATWPLRDPLLHHIIIHHIATADVRHDILLEDKAAAQIRADGGGVAFVHSEPQPRGVHLASTIRDPAQ